MFNSLTEYMGRRDDGLHYLKVRKFDDSNEEAPTFYFLFNEEKELVKTRLEQQFIGHYDFDIVGPLQ